MPEGCFEYRYNCVSVECLSSQKNRNEYPVLFRLYSVYGFYTTDPGARRIRTVYTIFFCNIIKSKPAVANARFQSSFLISHLVPKFGPTRAGWDIIFFLVTRATAQYQ